uniref:Uncharacterized protein n=1 Tax=Physcomitrium patens TaxID=3218 RepID=A0A2K1K214_PHYPA|nr:hypothetical protein PHYPA_012292 [Physcomitrium patens]
MVEDEELLPTTGACWRTCFPSVRPSVGLRRRLYRITVSSAVTICRYGTSYIEGNADQIKTCELCTSPQNHIINARAHLRVHSQNYFEACAKNGIYDAPWKIITESRSRATLRLFTYV